MHVPRAAPTLLLLTLGLAACGPYEGGEEAYYDGGDYYGYGPSYFGGFGLFDDFDDFEVHHRHHHHHHHQHDHAIDGPHNGVGRGLHRFAPPPSPGMTGQLQHRFAPPPRPPTIWMPRSPTITR
jgi:hypothetical protein